MEHLKAIWLQQRRGNIFTFCIFKPLNFPFIIVSFSKFMVFVVIIQWLRSTHCVFEYETRPMFWISNCSNILLLRNCPISNTLKTICQLPARQKHRSQPRLHAMLIDIERSVSMFGRRLLEANSSRLYRSGSHKEGVVWFAASKAVSLHFAKLA